MLLERVNARSIACVNYGVSWHSDWGGPVSSTKGTPPGFVVGLWGVRYQVKDVARSVAFYTQDLGFKLDRQNLPAFAQVSLGHLKLILSGPGASGSRLMPDGRRQEPGGWNRIVRGFGDGRACFPCCKKGGLQFAKGLDAGPCG